MVKPLEHQSQREYTYSSQWKNASNLYIALFVFITFVMVFCAIASANASTADIYQTELILTIINTSFAGIWWLVLAITLFVAIRNPQSENSIEKKTTIMIAVFATFLLFALYMFISQAYVSSECRDIYEGSLTNWNIKAYSLISTILLVGIVGMLVPALILSIQIYKRSSGNYVG